MRSRKTLGRFFLAAAGLGCLMAAVSTPVLAQSTAAGQPANLGPQQEKSQVAQANTLPAAAEGTRPIDLVIVLDTSGSMTELIDSARGRIWSIVLKLADAQPQPKLRLGLLTYGTPDTSMEEDGWIVKQADLTDQLDSVYTKMMAMSTEGGDEYVGWALHKALRNMTWTDDPQALRLIYIAGNESAEQGAEVHNFRDEAREAEGRDIIINALYAGPQPAGVSETWDKVPSGNGGEFFAIDMAAGTAQFATPFDAQLEVLNLELNATLLPYGKDGQQHFSDVISNDIGAARMGNTTNSSRIAAKACTLWCNSAWDLIDAVATKEFKLESIPAEELPEVMRKMSLEERQAYITAMKKVRAAVHAKIADVNAKREAFLQRVISATAGNAQQSLDEAIMTSLARQAKAKGFELQPVEHVWTPAEAEAALATQEEILFDLAVERLMQQLPQVRFEVGAYRTCDRELAEMFAEATEQEVVSLVDDSSFSKFEDAESTLQVQLVRMAAAATQVAEAELTIEDGSTMKEYRVAGQTFKSREVADEVAKHVTAALADAPAPTTPAEAREHARKVFAAGIRAVEEVQK